MLRTRPPLGFRAMGELAGKVAVVTGGASGIGAATCRRLADEGAKVVVTDVIDGTGQEVAEDVQGRFLHLDVTDAGRWQDVVDDVMNTEGAIDIAHLNAGVHLGTSDITEVELATYRTAMSVNVDGVFFGMQAVLGPMRAKGEGAIVATASLAGLIPYPIDPVYDATKHAVVGLVRSVAMVAGAGITVNCVNPGIVNTPMLGDEGLQMLTTAGFPVIGPEAVAEAVFMAATSGRSGEAWVVQPGVCEPFQFPAVPGPRTEGDKGKVPPILGPQGNASS